MTESVNNPLLQPASSRPVPVEEAILSDLSPETLSEIKDMLFDEFMKQKLIEDFFEELSDYLDDKDVDAMRGALAKHPEADIYATLSLPKELRVHQFSKFHEALESGSDPTVLMTDFVSRSSRYGFGLGYHTSAADIKPDEQSGRWEVVGREPDHRDNDLARAYYSSHYRHLYSPKDHQLYVKKAAPRFIYIVRTEPSHKTDGNWSRASRLSIVARVPYSDVVNYVESTIKKVEGRR